jgi:TPP-dependent pyruvate/acetoin dehydrogenase alpha subunit
MLRPRTIIFCQQWPDSLVQDGNTYWLGLDPLLASTQSNGTFVLGQQCRTLAELELVAQQLHAQINDAVASAKEKLQPDPAPAGFQTQVYSEIRSPKRP